MPYVINMSDYEFYKNKEKSQAEQSPEVKLGFKIFTKNNDPEELEVAKIVGFVCTKYKIPKFTDEIVIEKGAVPHSHPVLTLSTKTKNDKVLLKKLVHEQFHWYPKNQKWNEFIDYLKTKYKDDGEHNISGKHPDSYWGHIFVCFNTREYLKRILPAQDIEWIYAQPQPYPSLEKLLDEKYKEVKADLEKFDMVINAK